MIKIDNDRKMFTRNLFLQSLKIKALRKLLISIAESRMKKYIAASDYPFLPEMVSRKAFVAFKNLLESIETNYEKGNISFRYIKKFIRTLALSSHTLPDESLSFKARYGFDPPMFVLLSPTAVCNLNCAGCYADCDQKKRATMDFDICTRILEEKQASWGSYLTVISGGEPFMYHNNGKTIFDLFEAFPDNLFLVYTNGSLINEETAQRLARTGNVTPAISVEGFEKETDERRGPGMHRKILKAMENLRNAGVMFGLSVTLTSKNSDLFISDFDRFCEYYMDEQGAVFAWLFQYMPIGRDHDSFALLVPPEKRKALYVKTWRLIEEKGRFIADFWNSGETSAGCLAAGRSGGFIYIDWNGNVMPCVFNPYYTDNIKDVYAANGHLDDVLFSPLMRGLREWQNKYYLNREPASEKNSVLTCCPLKDHFRDSYKIMKDARVKFSNPEAEAAFADRGYYDNMVAYGDACREQLDPLWEKYLVHERKKLKN